MNANKDQLKVRRNTSMSRNSESAEVKGMEARRSFIAGTGQGSQT